MANSLVQFRIDDSIKNRAVSICEKLGIDFPTYLRMCSVRLVQENGVPFSMKLKESSGWEAVKEANRIAEENGISEMTLDEINAEITAYRKERRRAAD